MNVLPYLSLLLISVCSIRVIMLFKPTDLPSWELYARMLYCAKRRLLDESILRVCDDCFTFFADEALIAGGGCLET